VNTDFFEIRIYDRSSNQKAFFSSTARGHPILGGQFKLSCIEGCGKLTLTLVREKITGTIDHGYLIEVWAKPTGGTLTKYYTGRIITIPAAGTTALKVQYGATGLWYQVERQTVSKFYESADIDTIVEAILDDIDNDSDLSSSTSEISLASPYPLGDFEAESMSAAAALKLLAEVQGDVQYGVDQDTKLYFKDVSTTDVISFWVGKHLERFEPHESSVAVMNRAYMQSRQLVGGGHLTLVRDQTTGDHSISNLGLCDNVLQIPHLSDPDDVWRWAQKQLADSGIKTICDAQPTAFSEFVFPRGNARITDLDGTEYSLPIQSVTYRLDPQKGLVGSMEIGDEPMPTIEGEMKRLQRDIATSKSNAISLTKIEHTRGEEWQQESIIDAQDLGLQNHFTALFTDLKTVDEQFEGTVHTNLDTRRNFVTGPFPDAKWLLGQYWSKKIPGAPSGEDIDSVRCHFLFDMYGRLTFDYDEDLDDHFTYNLVTGSGQAWRVKEVDHLLEYDDTLGAGQLIYTGPNGFAWSPSGYKFRIGLKNFNRFAYGVYCWIYWDYQDSNNWNGIRIQNYTTVKHFRMINNSGGSQSNIGTPTDLTDLIDADCELEITARPSGSTSRLDVYRDGSLQGSITSTSAVLGTGNDVRLGTWAVDSIGPPDTPACDIDYFEIQEYNIGNGTPKIAYAISRTDGANLSGGALSQGTAHFTEDLSSQPSGGDLRMRLKVFWPARLYGWGLSF
jgi:hypothetical protein